MITVRECQYDEVKKFRGLEGEYHYMGESHGAGDMIRLVFEEDGKWIALMTWAAACYRLKPRDMEIGWNRAMCAKRSRTSVLSSACQKKELNRGRWEERETKAYLAGDPVDACVEKLAGHVRAHWCVEVYHGKRDNGYHEDKLTRRMDLNIMSAMMVARSLGMWVCARSPGKSTEAVQRDLLRHPSKLVRIMTKGGLL